MTLVQDDFAKAVQVARERYGARRIGVFVGTSTAGIRQTERGYRGYVAPFATALLLDAQRSDICLAKFTLENAHGTREDTMSDEPLEH